MMPLNLPKYPEEFIEAYVKVMMDHHVVKVITISNTIRNKYSKSLKSIFGSDCSTLIKCLTKEILLQDNYYEKIYSQTANSRVELATKTFGIRNRTFINSINSGSFPDYSKEPWYQEFKQEIKIMVVSETQALKYLVELIKQEEFYSYRSYFKALLLLTPEDMENFRQLNPGGMGGSFQDIKALYDLSQEININGADEKINTYMVKHFMVSDNRGLLVCPYCNRNYINSRDRKLGAEMDHFYNKDQFPMFAVSLYNFIPSCGTCNRIKLNKDLNINPYIVKTSGSPQVRFDIERRPGESYAISLKKEEDGQLVELSDELKHDIQEVLKLHDAYQVHEWDICDMVQREQEYGKEHRDFLVNLLSKQYSKEEVNTRIDDLIYGNVISMSEDELVNVSLGKFKKDAYKKIKEWTTDELI